MQLVKSARKSKTTRCTTSALKGAPQRKGICIRALTTSPKKPNGYTQKRLEEQVYSSLTL